MRQPDQRSFRLRPIIIAISLLTAIAFLALSIISAWQIFTLSLDNSSSIRAELWILMVLCFVGGIVLLGIAWGIVEMTGRSADETEAATLVPAAE